MKDWKALVAVALVFAGIIGIFVYADSVAADSRLDDVQKDKPDGKTVFLNAKCEACHSVSTAGIKAKNEKSGAPDLTDVTVRHDKTWIPGYIRRKEGVGHEHCDVVDKSRDGKQHKMAYKGSDEDCTTLVDWLDVQKSEEK